MTWSASRLKVGRPVPDLLLADPAEGAGSIREFVATLSGHPARLPAPPGLTALPRSCCAVGAAPVHTGRPQPGRGHDLFGPRQWLGVWQETQSPFPLLRDEGGLLTAFGLQRSFRQAWGLRTWLMPVPSPGRAFWRRGYAAGWAAIFGVMGGVLRWVHPGRDPASRQGGPANSRRLEWLWLTPPGHGGHKERDWHRPVDANPFVC